jgi:chromosome segregation ATPase
MPESLWSSETDALVEQQAEVEPVSDHESAEEEEAAEAHRPHVEDEAQQEITEESAPPIALAVSADDFSALEERVLRAVEMLRHERQARASAEVRIAEAEERASNAIAQLGPLQTQLDQQTPLFEQLQNEIFTLRAERDKVRNRVERLLEQLDSLEI